MYIAHALLPGSAAQLELRRAVARIRAVPGLPGLVEDIEVAIRVLSFRPILWDAHFPSELAKNNPKQTPVYFRGGWNMASIDIQGRKGFLVGPKASDAQLCGASQQGVLTSCYVLEEAAVLGGPWVHLQSGGPGLSPRQMRHPPGKMIDANLHSGPRDPTIICTHIYIYIYT